MHTAVSDLVVSPFDDLSVAGRPIEKHASDLVAAIIDPVQRSVLAQDLGGLQRKTLGMRAVMFVTSTVEVPMPSGSELILMVLNNLFGFPQLPSR